MIAYVLLNIINAFRNKMRTFVEHLIVLHIELSKESVLLRREISLKVFCEKVNFSNCDLCNAFRDYE